MELFAKAPSQTNDRVLSKPLNITQSSGVLIAGFKYISHITLVPFLMKLHIFLNMAFECCNLLQVIPWECFRRKLSSKCLLNYKHIKMLLKCLKSWSGGEGFFQMLIELPYAEIDPEVFFSEIVYVTVSKLDLFLMAFLY